jgi:hypothetical protein
MINQASPFTHRSPKGTPGSPSPKQSTSDDPKERVRTEEQAVKLKVRLIDGAEFRNQSIEQQEFGLWATHYDFEKIPEGEVWIDEHVSEEDKRYFLIDASEYVRTRKEGMDEAEAYDEGLSEERVERALETEGGEGERPHHDEIFEGVYLEKLQELEQGGEKIEVWLVDGQKVREMMRTDFVEGGHSFVYSWIPEKEIWIEQALDESEREFVIDHEFMERRLMLEGEDYDDAHEAASKEEFKAREGKSLDGNVFGMPQVGERTAHANSGVERSEEEVADQFHCPDCGGVVKSDGKSLWCSDAPCEWHKALSALAEGSGGALVGSAYQGWRCRRPPCRGGLHTAPPGEYGKIKALCRKYKKALPDDLIYRLQQVADTYFEREGSGRNLYLQPVEKIVWWETYDSDDGELTDRFVRDLYKVTGVAKVEVHPESSPKEQGWLIAWPEEGFGDFGKGNFNSSGPPDTELSDTRKPIEGEIKDYSAYVRGQEARQQGLSKFTCPYPGGSANREDWLRGYGEKSIRNVHIKSESYFATCKRDEGGQCLPSGEAVVRSGKPGAEGQQKRDVESKPLTGINEIIERMADAYEKKHGWKEGKSRDGFVKNWKRKLKGKAADPSKAKSIADSVETAAKSHDIPNGVQVIIRRATEDEIDRGVTRENAHWDPQGFVVMQEDALSDERGPKKELADRKPSVKYAYDDPIVGLYIHELGHRFHDVEDTQAVKRAQDILDEEGAAVRIEKAISGYANYNAQELVAESYAMRKHPNFDRLPDATKEIINQVLGEGGRN